MSKLVSIGEVLIDFQSVGTGSLKHIQQFIKNAGGAPANVCVQAAKLGQKAIYLTQVGDDGFGEFLIEELQNTGVDTSYIKKSKQYHTSLAFVSYKEDGEREFSFYRANAADLYFTKEDFKEVTFEQGDILEFGSVALKTEASREVHLDLIQRARQKDALICFDPNIRLNLWENHKELKEVILEYITYADIIKLSEDELFYLTDTNQIEEGMKQFKHQDKIFLITLGSAGAILYRNGCRIEVKGFKVKAVDTTGAGDSFFGGLISMLLKKGSQAKNLTLQEYQPMVEFACKCGAYTTTGFGAMKAMGNEKEIESVGK